MIDNLRDIVIALCLETSEKNNKIKPLTTSEFYELLSSIEVYNNFNNSNQLLLFEENQRSNQNIELAALRDIEADFMAHDLGLKGDLPEKIVSLMKRMNSLAFEQDKLESQGIKICTIFDADYPEKLKAGLHAKPNSLREPPILYYCGELKIAKSNFVGFVGSRVVNEGDVVWTQRAVEKICTEAEQENQIFGIVSGGAEGIDKIAEDTAINLAMPVVEFSKNMRITLKEPKYLDAIMAGKMLLISKVNPLRNLSRMEATSHFMNRNKYIYAASNYTIVVKSAKGSKSGTWAGASEALKRNIGKVFVRDVDYDGNQDLIRMGAKPLSIS
jgi:predicted Rossmann fold nucleotide-binding protein DprA/Smf involved in DNA uptake